MADTKSPDSSEEAKKSQKTAESGLTEAEGKKLGDDLLITCIVIAVVLAAGMFVTVLAVWNYAAVGLLWGLGCLAIGCLGGFIFGIPRVPPTPDDAKKPGANASSPGEAPAALGINTNLNEISDWLTKILVGLGLVQLRKVPDYVQRAGYYVGCGLGHNAQAAAGIIIFYLGLGFVSGYVLTRMFLSPAFYLADKGTAHGLGTLWARINWIGAEMRDSAKLGDILNAAYEDLQDKKIPRDAAQRYIDALQKFRNDPRWALHRRLHIQLGVLYKKVGDLDTAIDILTGFINRKKERGEIDIHTADALYNRACYYALQFAHSGNLARKAMALADLKASLNISPPNREVAKKDDDFKEALAQPYNGITRLADDPEFKAVVRTA